MPVLVLHGDSDNVMTSENAIFMAQNLKNVELEIVSGGNHALLHTDTEIVIKTIRKYLGDYFGL